MSSDEALERLFERASPRRAPPESDERAIRDALHAEWHAVVGRRTARTRAVRTAAAAAAAVLLGAVLIASRPDLPINAPVAVAQVERIVGSVEATGLDDASSAAIPRLGDELFAGQSLTTNDGGLSLALSPRGSLRIASDSRVRLISAAEIELFRGAIYFDSADPASSRNTSARLTVRTPFGTLRDIGTQFIARVEPYALDVRVRDGAVTVARDAGVIEATAGERISVAENGAVDRAAIALYGSDWEWVETLAPAFDIEGQSPAQFLTWIEEQTGRRVAYATPAAERLAMETVLRGAIDLEPMSMLAAVLATTDLDFTLVGHTIVVSVR